MGWAQMSRKVEEAFFCLENKRMCRVSRGYSAVNRFSVWVGFFAFSYIEIGENYAT